MSRSPSRACLIMTRRGNRPTLFFTNFSFWCNFEAFFDLDVENISNLLFSISDGRCVIINCVPILLKLLVIGYFDLVEIFYLFASRCICAKRYKISVVI